MAAPAVEFIAVMLRGWSEERAVREARRAAVWAGRGIVALDIAGDEAIGAFATLAPAVRVAREAGLAIDTHAGETGGARRDARGTRAARARPHRPRRRRRPGCPSSSPRCVTRGLHLAMALTSNTQTGTVPDPARHPFAALLRGGVSVGLNTDNRTISGTTLSDEYALAADTLGLTWAELARAAKLAAEATFAPAEVRRRLAQA